MLFDVVDETIPKGSEGKTHEFHLPIYAGPGWKVDVRFPGKYGPDDFVVEVVSEGVWDKPKKFKHADMFFDVNVKTMADPTFMRKWFAPVVAQVCRGDVDPSKTSLIEQEVRALPGINLEALVKATQVLSVCEYRRYPQGDVRGGGRYLPINFMFGIIFGHWTTVEATQLMRAGRPALDRIKNFQVFSDGSDVEFWLKSNLEEARSYYTFQKA